MRRAQVSRAPVPPEYRFENGQTVVWRKSTGLAVFNARSATRDKMGEGPFKLTELKGAEGKITRGDGQNKRVPLIWLESDASDGA